MKDFSYWKEYEGTSEGSGRSEKIWLQNPDTGQIGLFKLKRMLVLLIMCQSALLFIWHSY